MKDFKYKGKFVTAFEEDINGKTFERVAIRPGVRVYPLQDEKLLMIHEQREISQKAKWRFVSGWMDKEGLSPEQTAREELMEEVSYDAKKFIPAFTLEKNGTTIQKSYEFVAIKPFKLETPIENPDADIILDTKWVTLDDLYSMLDAQEVQPANEILVAVQILRNAKLYE